MESRFPKNVASNISSYILCSIYTKCILLNWKTKIQDIFFTADVVGRYKKRQFSVQYLKAVKLQMLQAIYVSETHL